MHWLIKCRKDHKDIIVARGPLLDDGGVKTIGGVLMLDVADMAEAIAFWSDERFNCRRLRLDDGAQALRPRVSAEFAEQDNLGELAVLNDTPRHAQHIAFARNSSSHMAYRLSAVSIVARVT